MAFDERGISNPRGKRTTASAGTQIGTKVKKPAPATRATTPVPFGSTTAMPQWVPYPVNSPYGPTRPGLTQTPRPPFGSTMSMPTYGNQNTGASNPVPTRTSTPINRTGSPGGGGGGGGEVPGGGGEVPGGEVPAEVPPATPLVTPDYKDDPEYVWTSNDLLSALADYKAAYNKDLANYGTGVETTFNRLGWNPATNSWSGNQDNPDSIYNQQYQGTIGDYAGRGMWGSGFATEALSGVDRDFQSRITDLVTQQKQYGESKGNDMLSYQKQNNSALKAAMLAAVQRLAQRYQMDPNTLAPTNTSNLNLAVDPNSIKLPGAK